MARYLGVDGGGARTAFVLIDEEGRILAETTGPSCADPGADPGLVRRVLDAGVATIERRARVDRADIDRSFFALPAPGGARPDGRPLDTLPSRVLGHPRYTCGDDLLAAWAGALGGEDGVHLVAGTGAVAYGEWGGRTARAGGWGELLGEEGSAYWVGVQGLAVVSRMIDGRLPRGPLHEAMRSFLGVASDAALLDALLAGGTDRRERVAALARVVVAAADAGDVVAGHVLDCAGAELAALVLAVRDRVAVPVATVVPVAYSGGMLWSTRVLGAFQQALGPGVALRRPQHGAAIGAALYARRRAA